MDGVSAAASVITLVELTTKVLYTCGKYYVAVRGAQDSIARLESKISSIRNILTGIEEYLKRPGGPTKQISKELSGSIRECQPQLESLQKRLAPGTGQRLLRHFRTQKLVWPFLSAEFEAVIRNLESIIQNFSVAINIDGANTLSEVKEEVEGLISDVDLAKIPAIFEASFDSHDNEYNTECLQGTRVDLLDAVGQWASLPKSPCLYWLCGKAGTGKSTIARTIARNFANEGSLGASFFFKRGEGDRGNATKFFTTIARQIIARIPDTAIFIRSAIRIDAFIAKRSLKDQFEKLILEPLAALKPESFNHLALTVVIDALDECDNREDMRTILQLLARAQDIKPISLRVFVTSRPELPISTTFRNISQDSFSRFVLHQVQQSTIERDIGHFLSYKFAIIAEKRGLPLSWPGTEMTRQLAAMAAPLFICAATICRALEDDYFSPVETLDSIIQSQNANPSTQLVSMYRPILEQVVKGFNVVDAARRGDRFREIVGPIIVLANPLPVESLANLLELSEDVITATLSSLHSVLDIPTEPDAPVRLFHLSFRDWLLDSRNHDSSVFWIDETVMHKSLACKCLATLNTSPYIKKDICNLEDPGILKETIPDEAINSALPLAVRYACRYWIYHVEKIWSSFDEMKLIEIFLERRVLFWIEAMGLMGVQDDAVLDIGRLHSLSQATGHDKLTRLLYDTRRFILKHCNIISEAPLQSYSSMLMFAPEQSYIRRSFERCKSPELRHLMTPDKQWNSLVQVLDAKRNQTSSYRPPGGFGFSQDGTLLFSTIAETVMFWSPSTGTLRSRISSDHIVWVCCISHDSKSVAIAPTGDIKVPVAIWDIATGVIRTSITTAVDGGDNWSYYGRPVSAAFTVDSKLIVIAYDHVIEAYEVATGRRVTQFDTRETQRPSALHERRYGEMTVSEDGIMAARILGDPPRVLLFDVLNQSLVKSFTYSHDLPPDQRPYEELARVKFSPSRKSLIVSYMSGISLYDIDSVDNFGKRRSNATYCGVTACGNHLLKQIENRIQLQEVDTGHIRDCEIDVIVSKFYGQRIAYSLPGRLLAIEKQGLIKMWDLSRASADTNIPGTSTEIHTCVSTSLDARLMLTLTYTPRTTRAGAWISIREICNGDLFRTIAPTSVDTHELEPDFLIRIAMFLPGRDNHVLSIFDNHVCIWDVTSGHLMHDFSLPLDMRSVEAVPSRDSHYLAVYCFRVYSERQDPNDDKPTVFVFDLEMNPPKLRYSTQGRHVSFSCDQQYIISFNPNLFLFDTAQVNEHASPLVKSLGQLWIHRSETGEKCHSFQIMDTSDSKCRPLLEKFFAQPHGSLVAGYKEGMLYVCDSNSGEVTRLKVIDCDDLYNSTSTLSWSPDGKRLAVMDSVGGIHIIRADDFSTSVHLRVQGSRSVSFTDDGTYLQTDVGTIRIPTNADNVDLASLCSDSLLFTEEWIWFKGRRTLWIPPDIRPLRHQEAFSVAVVENKVFWIDVSHRLQIVEVGLSENSV